MTTTIKVKTITIKSMMLLLVMSFAFACSDEKSNTATTAATPAATPAATTAATPVTAPAPETKPETTTSYAGDTQMEIGSTGFRGIEVGDAISKHSSDYVKKGKLKTGEGSFDVYKITDFENNPAGYFIADPKNKLLVGDITVETPKASDDKGIKVGDTFKDLLKAYPNIEVHGSESESRTYATKGNLSYRLNVANNTYDVDKSKIPATAKITEIVINRRAGK